MAEFILITAVIITLVSHTWATRFHFDSGRLSKRGIILVSSVAATAVIYTYLLYLNTQPELAIIIGLILIVVSNVIFWWAIIVTRQANLLAAFTESKPSSLVETGPYRYVRHPFYTSYIIFWVGFAVATATILSLIPLVYMFWLYNRAAAQEEAFFSQTEMAETYAQFAQKRGRFFPFY